MGTKRRYQGAAGQPVRFNFPLGVVPPQVLEVGKFLWGGHTLSKQRRARSLPLLKLVWPGNEEGAAGVPSDPQGILKSWQRWRGRRLWG